MPEGRLAHVEGIGEESGRRADSLGEKNKNRKCVVGKRRIWGGIE